MTKHPLEYIHEDVEEIERLQAINADLLAALEAAREELHECAMELLGEPYNNPTMNAAIAKAKE